MSKLIVEVCRIDAVERHPNADRLAIATIKGWKTCIGFDPDSGKAEFDAGDRIIYIPPDCVLPPELANGPEDDPKGRLNNMKYLGMLPKNPDGSRPAGGRVKAARLRGVPSYGFPMRIDSAWGDDPSWPVGHDVAEHFGITKWEPPFESTDPDSEPEHPRFHHYTEMENIGNFPDAIADGAEVVFTEKLHGKNCRVGLIHDVAEDGSESWIHTVGSFSSQRKQVGSDGVPSKFWMAMTENVKQLLAYVKDELPWDQPKASIVMFGELFGSGVQDMAYGMTNGAKSFRAFDLAINGLYLDLDLKVALFKQFGIETVPLLYRGPFSRAVLEHYTSGPTTMCAADKAGKFTGREGIVITPVKEVLYSPILNGRLIVKSVSADYLGRKGGTDSH